MPKPGAFEGLKLTNGAPASVDQRLFQRPASLADSVPSFERPSDRKDKGTTDRTLERKDVRPKGRTDAQHLGKTAGRRAAGPGKTERIVEHRPYDFFQDQVRWLNRKKVEFEEQHGKRIAATAMVQLAVDMLIADFEANGEDSQLVRVLVKEERPSVRPFGGSEERPEGGVAGG